MRVWLLIACLVVPGALPANGPRPRLPKDVKVLRDLVYADIGQRTLKLDLYLPTKGGDPRPLVVFIHGGGWVKGDKSPNPGAFLVPFGFASASLEYRFSDEAKFPAQIHDCKAAVRWLRSHVAGYGIDPGRIGVWGASAGGHLAALLGTSGGVAPLEGDEGVTGVSSRVQAVCDWFGPANFGDFLQQAEAGPVENVLKLRKPGNLLERLLGADPYTVPEKARLASPVTFVSADDPPFLIMQGALDALVPAAQSQELLADLRKCGVDARLELFLHSGHGRGEFARPESFRMVAEFFSRTLR